MNYFKKILLFLGTAVLFSSLFIHSGFAASSFTIGVISDCKAASRTQLLGNVKSEIQSLVKGEFKVLFPPKFNIVSDCTEKSIHTSIDKLLKDPEVDMVLALGFLSSQLLSQTKDFSKPSIAGLILNPDIQGVPLKNNKSGKHNFSYVALSTDLKNNIEQFKEIAPFKTAAYLYDDSLSRSMTSGSRVSEKIEKETGVKLTFIPVGKDLGAVKKQLHQNTEAVFMGYLAQLDEAQSSDLMVYVNKHKIPSFSFHDRKFVADGLLAGFDRSAAMNRLSRRIALLVQRILFKEDPRAFKVGFSTEENLVINMQTAKELNISPSFSLLAKAELIKSESQVTSDLQKNQKPGEPIALSSLATGGEMDMNITALGLNDTEISLSLLDAVNRALENNQLLKSREKQTEAGKMNVKDALSKFYPQLGAGLTGTVIDKNNTSELSGVAERSWDISARVTQLLYSDQVYTNLKTSRHLQTVQELSEYQERLDIIFETGLAYLNILKARADARIQLENLKLVRSNLVLANNRYKAGSASPSDVYRLESESATAYANFLVSLTETGKARLRLNQLLNFNQEDNTTIQDIRLGDGVFVVGDPKLQSVLKINNPKDFRKFRDFVVKKGLEASPEIKAIKEQIMIQTDAYNLAKRSYWSPNIFVNGYAGNTFSKSGEGSNFNSSAVPDSLSSIFEEPDDSRWGVSLNIDIPFFEGGAKSAAKIKALETKNQLMFFKYDIQNQISENIRAALFNLGASHPSIELTRLSAESARKNLDLVQDAYSNGAVSIVNFLDAQNAALVANTSADNAVYDFFIDLITAERASGTYTFLLNKDGKNKWIQEFQKN